MALKRKPNALAFTFKFSEVLDKLGTETPETQKPLDAPKHYCL